MKKCNYFNRIGVAQMAALAITLPFQMLPVAEGATQPENIEISDISGLCVRFAGVGETGIGKPIGTSGATRYELSGSAITVHVAPVETKGEAAILIDGNYGQVKLHAKIVLNVGAGTETITTVSPYVFRAIAAGGDDYKTDVYMDGDGRVMVERGDDGSTTIYDEHENPIMKRLADGTTKIFDAYQGDRLTIDAMGNIRFAELVLMAQQVASNTEAIQGIAATGGASVSSAVLFPNGNNLDVEMAKKAEKVRVDIVQAGQSYEFKLHGDTTALTFGQLNQMLQVSPNFIVFVHDNREHRCVRIEMDGNPKYMEFVSPVVDSVNVKVQSFLVESVDGVQIFSVKRTDIICENKTHADATRAKLNDLSQEVANNSRIAYPDGTKIVNIADMSLSQSDTYYNGKFYIMSNGYWAVGDTNNDCLFFHVSKGSILSIQGSATKTSKIAFVADETPVSGRYATFRNATNSRLELDKGEHYTFAVLEDCTLYVYGYPDYFPSSIVVAQNNGLAYTCDVEFELGYIDPQNGRKPNGGLDDFEESQRSKYFISTNGARYIHADNVQFVRVVEYDENFYCIGSTRSNNSVKISDACKFVKLVTNRTDNRLEFTFLGGNSAPEFIRDKQLTENYDSFAISIDGDLTSLRLALPSNYSQVGYKCPLIVYISGDGGFTNWNAPMYTTDGEEQGIKFLQNEGFAVLKIYPWGKQYADKYAGVGITSAFPLPIARKCYQEAIKYVCDRYNINANSVHIISYSGGGKMSLFYALQDKLAQSIYSFSPTLSLGYSGRSSAAFAGWRKLFLDESAINVANAPAGFADDTTFDMLTDEFKQFVADYGQWIMADPSRKNLVQDKQTTDSHLFDNAYAYRRYKDEGGQGGYPIEGYMIDGELVKIYQDLGLARIGNGTPIHFLADINDEQCPTQASIEMSAQLVNGGTESRFISLPSGGHAAATAENTKLVTPKYSSVGVNIAYGWRYAAHMILTRFEHKITSIQEVGEDVYAV